MSGTTDKAKGRVKEAVGALANDKTLKREGKIDQAVGAVKEVVSDALDTVRNVFTKASPKRAISKGHRRAS